MHYFILCIVPIFLFCTPFKVASYNVQNLFDAKIQGTEYSEYIPNRHRWSKRMSQIKLNNTAEVICDMDADILGLQEVENSQIFEALIRRLKRVGCRYRYFAITAKKNATIQVALLSKFPINYSKDIQVSYASKIRNILEVEVSIEENTLILFVNHWKSKSRKGYESKRIVYAKALKRRIDTLPSGKEYIILGDLNSNYDAHILLNKNINNTNGITAISDIMKTIKEDKLLNKSQIINLSKRYHYNTWQDLAYKNRWSHKYYGNKSTLDHILLPSVLFDKKGIDYVNNSFNVFRASYLFTKKGYINSWQIRGGRHIGKGYSDHLPIYAYFDTKPYIHLDNSIKDNILAGDIEYFYTIDELLQPIELKDVIVIFKRGKYALIKQKEDRRGIFIYGSVNGLEEGKKYDLQIREISTYKGLKEITNLVVVKKGQKVKLKYFYKNIDCKIQNEILTDINGIYRDNFLYVDGKKIPIYFKNRKFIPRSGSKLKIYYAHLGYYKRLQLVIYSKKDFIILEK